MEMWVHFMAIANILWSFGFFGYRVYICISWSFGTFPFFGMLYEKNWQPWFPFRRPVLVSAVAGPI
jgi:hypothetical protein